MLYKTRGIAFNSIPFKESSIIAKIFTEEFGIQSYIVNSVRSAKGKTKSALFQSFSLLDLVVYKNPQKDIQRISEIKIRRVNHEIAYNYGKTTLALFLCDILNKILKSEIEEREVFAFLDHSIELLDKTKKPVNFHLFFLLNLLSHLGIDTLDSLEMDEQNLSGGDRQNFVNLPVKERLMLPKLRDIATWEDVQLNKPQRLQLIDFLMNYYSTHYIELRNLKSLQVLRETMA